MMEYFLEPTEDFKKQLEKIKRRDPVLTERIKNKLKEVRANPEHFKPLKNILSGYRRVHVDSFVIIFSIDKNNVVVHYIKHHDEAY